MGSSGVGRDGMGWMGPNGMKCGVATVDDLLNRNPSTRTESHKQFQLRVRYPN